MGAGRKEQVTGQCPEPQEIEAALKRVREHCAMVDATTETIDDESEDGVATTCTRTDSDIEQLQQEDEAISRFLYWAPTGSESSCSPLGPNLIPNEQAVQHGPEVPDEPTGHGGQSLFIRIEFCTGIGFNQRRTIRICS